MVLVFALPKRSYSPNEKRMLASAPKLTAEDLFSGEFGKDVETFLSDQFAGRDFFVGLNAYYDLCSGRNGANGIYKGSDDYLIAKPVQLDEENLSKNLTKINAFAENSSIPVHMMVVPTTGYIMDDKLPPVHDAYHDGDILSLVRETLVSDIGWIDLEGPFLCKKGRLPALLQNRPPLDLRGAYTAYLEFCGAMGLQAVPESDFRAETYGGFRGTSYSKKRAVALKPDDIELWKDDPCRTSMSPSQTTTTSKATASFPPTIWRRRTNTPFSSMATTVWCRSPTRTPRAAACC